MFYTANGTPREGAFADVRLCMSVRAVCVLCVGEKCGRPRALIPPPADALALSYKRQFARTMIDYHRTPAHAGDTRQGAVAGQRSRNERKLTPPGRRPVPFASSTASTGSFSCCVICLARCSGIARYFPLELAIH